MMKKAVRVIDTRQFLRHPLDVPLTCVVSSESNEDAGGLLDISDGGASFFSAKKLRKGQTVGVTFPVFKNCPVLRGKIVWTTPSKDAPGQFVYGLKCPTGGDKKVLQLIEHICHIMSYRVMQEHITGHAMTANEAAREWISKYSGTSPD